MAYRYVLYEKRGRIAYVTINRPEVMNAVHRDANAELTEVFQVVIAVHTLPAQSSADVVEVVVPLLPQPAKSNAAARPIRSTGIIVRIAQPSLTALVGPRTHDERRAITEVTRATSRHRTPTHAAGAPRTRLVATTGTRET